MELEIKALDMTIEFMSNLTPYPISTTMSEVTDELNRLNLALLREKRDHQESKDTLTKQLERREKAHAARIRIDLDAQAVMVEGYTSVINDLKSQIEQLKKQIK
jgi:hypothetical protein